MKINRKFAHAEFEERVLRASIVSLVSSHEGTRKEDEQDSPGGLIGGSATNSVFREVRS